MSIRKETYMTLAWLVFVALVSARGGYQIGQRVGERRVRDVEQRLWERDQEWRKAVESDDTCVDMIPPVGYDWKSQEKRPVIDPKISDCIKQIPDKGIVHVKPDGTCKVCPEEKLDSDGSIVGDCS